MSRAELPQLLTRFDLSIADARRAQQLIPPLVIRRDAFRAITTVAGADIAFSGDTAYAALVLFSFPQLEEMERATVSGRLSFPYVPGLLAFREIPLLLRCFNLLKNKVDLILADAHGWAHPRRAGLACHLGLLLDTPTIGCAKSLLVGEYAELGRSRGCTSPLLHDGERVGAVLRTREGVRPVFVSCGHRVSLRSAIRLVLGCCDGFRIPKPQRVADQLTKQLRAGARS